MERIAFILVLVLAGVSAARAQLPTGTVVGVVTDSSGAAVPDAKVSITNTNTNDTRTVTTGSDGAYRIDALRPGPYRVSVTKEGFKTADVTSLTLDVAQELVANTMLEVGSVAQEVTVNAEFSPQVNTTTSSLGGLVTDQQVVDLPLNGRNFVDLALLQPGVTSNTNGSIGGSPNGTTFSSNGAPVRANNFTMDGAPMMNVRGSTASAVGTTLGVDGIQEYRVLTNSFGAEYGLNMGSQVVIVSKGGTNTFHGDVFDYLRNNLLDARNYFDKSYLTTGKRLPELQRNNFGASFGGPIQKDKTFFYAVYEGLRQNQGASIVDNVLPANCHVATANPCATVSGGVVNATIYPFLALYPNPNVPGTSQFALGPVYPTVVDYGQIRVDHTFSATDSIFARYTIDNSSSSQLISFPGTAYQGVGGVESGRDQFLTLSENHIFSPTLLNTARISYSRTLIEQTGNYPAVLAQPQYAFVQGQAMGSFSVSSGLTGIGNGSFPQNVDQNLYTISDDLYYTKGRHALKFGTLLNRIEYYTINQLYVHGSVSFPSLPSFLAGTYTSASFLTPGSNTIREPRFYTYGFYAEDDWRFSSRLTFNLGLRYEPASVPYLRGGANYAFRSQTAPMTTQGPVFRNSSLKDLGPRVGFAWDVRGNGKTSVRAAFGEYYDLTSGSYSFYTTGQGTPPLSSTIVLTGGTISSLPLVTTGAGATIGNSLHTTLYDVSQPHMLQWNMTVEQQLAPSVALSVSYVGTRGIHLWDNEEGNPCLPLSVTNGVPYWGTAITKPCINPTTGASTRLNPNWGDWVLVTTNADSYYDGLQTVVTKRVTHGLEAQVAYTWSHTIDDAQGLNNTTECVGTGGDPVQVLSPERKEYDRGPACFDITNNIRAHVLYHLPTIAAGNCPRFS